MLTSNCQDKRDKQNIYKQCFFTKILFLGNN